MFHSLFKSIKTLSVFLALPIFCWSCSSGQKASNYTQPNQQPIQYIQGAPQRSDGYYYSQPPSYYGGYQAPAPASRYYSNPYAFPPQNAYPYYDGDQYYVPPTYYGVNRDNNAPTPATQKY